MNSEFSRILYPILLTEEKIGTKQRKLVRLGQNICENETPSLFCSPDLAAIFQNRNPNFHKLLSILKITGFFVYFISICFVRNNLIGLETQKKSGVELSELVLGSGEQDKY